MRQRLVVGLLAGILGTAGNTFADPIQVTAGFYLDIWGRGTRWELSGDGFHLAGVGGRLKSSLLQCFSCAPGTTINLDMVLSENFGPGPAEFNGNQYDQVWWTGSLDFDSGTLPASAGTFYLPFAMTGTLTGFGTAARTGPPLFSIALTGTGTVEAFFTGFAQEVEFDRVRYAFADPVPEPATMLLLGTGLAALVARRRTRAR